MVAVETVVVRRNMRNWWSEGVVVVFAVVVVWLAETVDGKNVFVVEVDDSDVDDYGVAAVGVGYAKFVVAVVVVASFENVERR